MDEAGIFIVILWIVNILLIQYVVALARHLMFSLSTHDASW